MSAVARSAGPTRERVATSSKMAHASAVRRAVRSFSAWSSRTRAGAAQATSHGSASKAATLWRAGKMGHDIVRGMSKVNVALKDAFRRVRDEVERRGVRVYIGDVTD